MGIIISIKNIIIIISLIIVVSLSFFLGRSSPNITGLAILEPNSENTTPSDRIKDNSIRAFENRIVIYINDSYLANFTDTHSMEPVLDKKSTGIEVVPDSSNEIRVGDIISYTNNNEIIIHRVVKIGYDPEWYAITKGDNNPTNDPERVRFNQVKRILVGILY